ncbi:hypothetical protein U1Q18_000122 [Sarracenia purpurea var. burkii]
MAVGSSGGFVDGGTTLVCGGSRAVASQEWWHVASRGEVRRCERCAAGEYLQNRRWIFDLILPMPAKPTTDLRSNLSNACETDASPVLVSPSRCHDRERHRDEQLPTSSSNQQQAR